MKDTKDIGTLPNSMEKLKPYAMILAEVFSVAN